MVYKLFYTPLIRVSKTVVNNFLNLLINDFYNLITNFVVKEITVLKNVKFIPKLSSIYYVVSDASFTGCNKMLVANQNLILLLTITFRDIRGKLHRIFYTLGEFPKISLDKVFNINGLQKVFINKTILNKKGVYYNAYIKGQQPVVYCRYLLNEYITFYLIKENGIYFIIFNNFKLDVLSFFVYLGIPVSYVLKYLEDINFDKYKQLYYSDVLSNTCIVKKDSILVLIKAIQLNFSLDKKIWFNLYSAAYKTAFCLEIINICNFLTKIEFNKNSLTDLDSLSSKQVITINNYFLYYFKLHLNKHIKDINNDIKTILLDIETNKLNIDLKIKAKNYFTLKEHLTVNPHIQCLDTTNSLAELVQKNKISQSDSSLHNIAIRDVKLNNLGFISPIDTTEGINCGLTLSLTKNVRLSVDNKLEIPALNNKKNKSSLGCVFMTPCSLKKTSVILTNQVYRKNKCFSQERVSLFKTSFKTNNNRPNSFSVVNYKNIFSHSENLIPFLFYNDPTRVLMAARMQTQALPLVKKTPYFISTGEEKNVGFDNLRNLRSKHEGVVTYVSNNKVIIRDIYNRKHIYYLEKFRDNNYSIHNQSPII